MNILIINLHSALNLGDDAILKSSLKLLNNRYPESRFSLMANHPQSWEKYSEINIVPSFINYTKGRRKSVSVYKFVRLLFYLFFDTLKLKFPRPDHDIMQIIEAFDTANIIFSCGGGNFYSNSFFAFDLILNTLCLVYSGAKKKQVVMLPQSFGPFKKKFHVFLLKIGLKFSEFIFAREKISFELLEGIKIPQSKIDLLPDLALALDSSIQNFYNKTDKFYVGVTIIDREKQFSEFKNQGIYQEELVNTLNYLSLFHNASFYLFVQCRGPSQDQNDNNITQKFYEELKENGLDVQIMSDYNDAESIINDFSDMNLIIASRLHTAIFGIINYLPTLLIGYQPKAKGLYDLLGLEEYYLSIDDIKHDTITNKVVDLIENETIFIRKVRRKLPDIKNKIEERITTLEW